MILKNFGCKGKMLRAREIRNFLFFLASADYAICFWRALFFYFSHGYLNNHDFFYICYFWYLSFVFDFKIIFLFFFLMVATFE